MPGFVPCLNTWGLPNYFKVAVKFIKHMILASSALEYVLSCNLCVRKYVNTRIPVGNQTTQPQKGSQLIYSIKHNNRFCITVCSSVYYSIYRVCVEYFLACVWSHHITRQLNSSLPADWLVCVTLFEYLWFTLTSRYFRCSSVNPQ